MDDTGPTRADDPGRTQVIPLYGQLAERVPDRRDEQIAALTAAFDRAAEELGLEEAPAADAAA
jgi:hypothetical protein